MGRKRHGAGARKLAPTPIGVDEVRAMIGACTKGSLGIRNAAMLTTLLHGGLRVGEVCRLRISDVGDRILRVAATKRCRSRVVGVSDELDDVLRRWMDRRLKLRIKSTRLFCTLQGEDLTDDAVRQLLRRLAAKAGVESRVAPQCFRRGWAVHLVTRGGLRIDEIAEAAGHASIRTTAIYLGTIGATTAVDAVRRVQW